MAYTEKEWPEPEQELTAKVPVGNTCVAVLRASTEAPPSIAYLKKELASDDVYVKLPFVEVGTSVAPHVPEVAKVVTGLAVSAHPS